MAIVQGIKEKVHLPIYDSLAVEGTKQLRNVETTSILKFFVNVQGKTKLQTNLQSASLLPHYNTFEARAMRVVISDLPPEFPTIEELEVTGEGLPVLDDSDPPRPLLIDDSNGNVKLDENGHPATSGAPPITADIAMGLDRAMELLAAAQESESGNASLDPNDSEVELKAGAFTGTVNADNVTNFGQVTLSISDLKDLIADLDEKDQPPREQLGDGTVISKIIYNTITTLYVGEKIMIQMPTWYFPAGAGPYSEHASFTTHGKPSPLATFRFAEPVFIDRQQNFRVEIEVPDTDTLKQIQRIYGPLNLWVVLDGYMTRDVQ